MANWLVFRAVWGYPQSVDSRETYDSFSAAVIAQLNGEITAAGLNRAEIARALGVDYKQLGRYLKGEREIPVHILWAIIDLLPKVDEATLLKRARDRFDGR